MLLNETSVMLANLMSPNDVANGRVQLIDLDGCREVPNSFGSVIAPVSLAPGDHL